MISVSALKVFLNRLLVLVLKLSKSFKEPRDVLGVTVVMKRPLGIGDVVMLSPIFEAFENYKTKRFVTNLPVFLDLMGWEISTKTTKVDGLLVVPSFTFSEFFLLLRWRGPLYVNFGNGLCFSTEKHSCVYKNPMHYIENLKPLLGGNIKYPQLKVGKHCRAYDIVCFPFVNWDSRQWPKGRWARLLSTLSEKYTIAILGGDTPEEKEWNRSFDGVEGITNLTGMIGLDESINIISKSKIVVCQDSGPFHLSYMSRGPKVLVLFGVTNSNTRLPLDPVLRDKIVVFEDVSCPFHSCYNGLQEPKCVNEVQFQCIKKTGFERVFHSVIKNIETCVE